MVPALFDCLPGDEINAPVEDTFEFFFHFYEIDEGVNRTGLEVHDEVDVTVGAEIVRRD